MENKASKKKPPFFESWLSTTTANGVRYNSLLSKEDNYIRSDRPEIKNVYHIFASGLNRDASYPCLAWREGDRYHSLSYKAVNEQIVRLAKGLRVGEKLKKNDFVGLYSANSPQWMTTALACASSGFVLVPLYDTLGAAATKAIVKEVEMSLLFVDSVAATEKIYATLLENGEYCSLKKIVLLGPIGKFQPEPVPEELVAKFKAVGVTIKHVSTLISETKALPDQDAASYSPDLDDLYMVQYTSGTTGTPKGVMLNHGCVTSNCAAIQNFYVNGSIKGYSLTDCGGLICLHYLPLAHSYGQLVALACIASCGTVAFFSGNVANLAEDAKILRPSYLPLVPRLMNKVYSKVLAELEQKSPLAQKVFWYAYRKKLLLVKRGIITRSSIWDRLVFQKLQAKLGGEVKFMMTASAPVGAEVLEFWRVCFGVHLFEGYGQTEATALVTAAVHPGGGNVGHPVICNSIKLADVPDMGIEATSGRGEVCIKGTNVMKGYYKRPDLTKETIDEEGWLHTGDIGEFTPSGALRLVDRKKHIFKLAQGEYIAPEKIESVYACSPLVAQVFVDGSSLQWFVVAVVVPDLVEAKNWAVKEGILSEEGEITLEEICENSEYRNYMLNSLLELGKAKGLNQLEQIKSLYLSPEMFTVQNDLLTPSMKNRRPQLRNRYKVPIDKLYADGPIVVRK